MYFYNTGKSVPEMYADVQTDGPHFVVVYFICVTDVCPHIVCGRSKMETVSYPFVYTTEDENKVYGSSF